MADDDKTKVQDSKQEEVTETPATEDTAQEATQEATQEETPVEVPKEVEEAGPASVEEPKTPTKELTGKLAKIAEEIEGLTVLELSELSSYLEERFGVSASPMMAMGAVPVAGGAAAGEPAEEKSSFNVVLTDGGANKLGAIKAVRELRQDLGLMEAKKMVETPPQTILENVKKDEADAAVKKLTEAGAKAELK